MTFSTTTANTITTSTTTMNGTVGTSNDDPMTTNNKTKKEEVKKNSSSSSVSSYYFLNYCSLLSRKETVHLVNGTDDGQGNNKLLLKLQETTTNKDIVLQQAPMTFVEEIVAIIVLAIGPPNGVFTIPIVTSLIGKFLLGNNIALAFKYLALYILLPLFLIPQSFYKSTLTSYVAQCIVKYFSFRFIYETLPPDSSHKELNNTHRPEILVAPPHGVFPYGNILALFIWPSLTMGRYFQGLAANSALRVPIFKQLLCSIGVIDASRESATRALQNYPYTIGISTGGVAEVFETNADDECIVLKERIGLIKLAIRTGADLVPCYLFGNTRLLSCWAGEGIPNGRSILEKVSRKIGFALIIFYGRWYLPIPRRIPVLGVRGKPIRTYQYNCPKEPTNEQIYEIQKQLLQQMQDIFNNYKHLYGWDDKHLIIK